MIVFLETLGSKTLGILSLLGRSFCFLLRVVSLRPKFSWRAWRRFVEQLHFVGVLSLLIIVVSALFIGMVVGLQGYTTLSKFSAEQQLGQLVALSIVRELGPVISALLFAGRAGSAVTAEIGLMKALNNWLVWTLWG